MKTTNSDTGDYTFGVLRYQGGPCIAATHVAIWADGNDREYVALVAKSCAKHYDSSNVTEQIARRVIWQA